MPTHRRSRSRASRADNENGAENPTGSDSAGAGELALDVQVLNMAGDTLAQSRVDPRLCNGIVLKHLIEIKPRSAIMQLVESVSWAPTGHALETWSLSLLTGLACKATTLVQP